MAADVGRGLSLGLVLLLWPTGAPAQYHDHVVDLPDMLEGVVLSRGCDVDGDGTPEVLLGFPDAPFFREQLLLFAMSDGRLGPLPVATYEPERTGTGLGASIACLGDVDGDGNEDMAVVAPGYEATPTFSRTFYLPGPDPLSAPVSVLDDLTQRVWAAGDVDGDGHPDLVGSVFGGFGALHSGTPAGLVWGSTWAPVEAFEDVNFAVMAAAGVGDLDGDGFGDVVVSGAVPGFLESVGTGSFYVFLGAEGGLANEADHWISGDPIFGQLGRSLAAVGDVDGDGRPEVLAGAPATPDPDGNFRGAAHLFDIEDLRDGSPGWSLDGPSTGTFFGGAVEGLGDVNGDGPPDFAVVGVEERQNIVTVFLGGPGEPRPVFQEQLILSGVHAVKPLGDLNHDGNDDFGIVTAGNPGNPNEEPGTLRVYFGDSAWGGDDDDDSAPADDDDSAPLDDDDSAPLDDDDSVAADDDDSTAEPAPDGCSCSQAGAASWPALGLLPALRRRRRSA